MIYGVKYCGLSLVFFGVLLGVLVAVYYIILEMYVLERKKELGFVEFE
jgi:hypothetical protein